MGMEGSLGYEELKGVLHVKERERDTFVQNSEEKKAKNVEKIYHMRLANGALHKDVVFHRNGGKNTVARIFCNRPDEKHLMKEKTIKVSAELMDNKAFEKSRQLELLRYELRKLKENLQEKRERLAEAKDLMEADLEGNRIKDYLKAQNRVELMKMRHMDARNTARYFKRIIQSLKKDIYDMSERIKTMQKTRREKAVVVEELAKIRSGAVQEYKQCQEQMKPFHTMVEQKMREYDNTLRKKKKEHMEQNRETIQKCNAETKIEVVEEERPEVIHARDWATCTELKNYQDIFDEVKEALEISDVKDILSRVEEEHARYTRLCQQLEESNNHHDMLHEELIRLRQELQVLMYDTKSPGMTPEEQAELEHEAQVQAERVRVNSEKLREKESIIAGIKLATVAIHSKLVYVKLKKGERCVLEGDPVKDMEVIWNKTEKLMEQYGGKRMDEGLFDKKDITNFAELRLPADNLRTTLRSLDYRSHDNLLLGIDDTQVGYVSRDDIKKRSADILKPKKKSVAGGAARKATRKR